MDATTVAVDLAKMMFEVAIADRRWHIVARHRFKRQQFTKFPGDRVGDRRGDGSVWHLALMGGSARNATVMPGGVHIRLLGVPSGRHLSLDVNVALAVFRLRRLIEGEG